MSGTRTILEACGYYSIVSFVYSLYVLGPYKPHDIEDGKNALRILQSVKEVPLIDVSTLREAWPQESFKEREESQPFKRTEEARADPSVLIPLLADLSLDITVRRWVEEADTADLEELDWLPGKGSQIMAILRKMDPIPVGAARLLKHAFVESKMSDGPRVDLSKFQLSGALLADVLSLCSLEVETLDLSYNTLIRARDLPAIVAAVPRLRRLVLMGCTRVKRVRLFPLLRERRKEFNHLEGIYHRGLLTLEKPANYSSAFTYCAKRQTGHLICASIPLFTPGQVVQALSDVIPWQPGAESFTDGPPDLSDSIDYALPLVAVCAFQGGARAAGVPFGERAVVTVPGLSMHVPRGEKELWAFYLCLEDHGMTTMGRFMSIMAPREPVTPQHGWAFLRLTAREGEKPQEGVVPLEEEYNCEVYDLDGFLAQMEREGRPMPYEDVVRTLRGKLDTVDPETGNKRVEFLSTLELGKVEKEEGGGGRFKRFGEFYFS